MFLHVISNLCIKSKNIFTFYSKSRKLKCILKYIYKFITIIYKYKYLKINSLHILNTYIHIHFRVFSNIFKSQWRKCILYLFHILDNRIDDFLKLYIIMPWFFPFFLKSILFFKTFLFVSFIHLLSHSFISFTGCIFTDYIGW